MKILFLGPDNGRIRAVLEETGDHVMQYNEAISPRTSIVKDANFIISYGYRYILRKEVLSFFFRKAINLHISYLPWNKGADPNVWSFVEDTPKGVSIHYISDGIDTGDILAQRIVEFENGETLKSSYQRLKEEMEKLFIEFWKDIRTGKLTAKPQKNEGTYHCKKDLDRIKKYIAKGWDTPVSILHKCNTNG